MGGKGGRGERRLWEHRVFQDSEAQRSCCRSLYHGGNLIGRLMQGTSLYVLVIFGVNEPCSLAGCFRIDPQARVCV